MRRVPLGNTIYPTFTTRNFSTGAPHTLSGGVVLIYEENNTTQITSGVGLTAGLDGVTGFNQASIAATSGNGFSVGKAYTLMIGTGTVNSVSVVGEVIEQFEVVPAENQTGVPIVDTGYVGGTAQTANDNGADINTLLTRIAQTLNLTASGNIGIDWANVENPTTAVDLSGTDIQLVDTCTTNTDMRGTDSAALASVCTEARLSELDAATAGKMANQVDIIQTDTTTDIPATIATAQSDLDTLTGADGVTLATSQPNYAPATAAALAVVDTVVDSILVDTGITLDTKINTIDTIVDAIKAKTDSLTFTVSNQVDANIQSINDVTITGDGSATPFTV